MIPKHRRRLTGFDEKILALYAKGMTTRDIQQIVKELYDVDASPTLISEITADLDAQVTACAPGSSTRFGQSSTSTASWCMCAVPMVEYCHRRCTWPWA